MEAALGVVGDSGSSIVGGGGGDVEIIGGGGGGGMEDLAALLLLERVPCASSCFFAPSCFVVPPFCAFVVVLESSLMCFVVFVML